ncbi:MAG: VCBS repeat-containing protein [Pyrinomonadaceae bacterium]
MIKYNFKKFVSKGFTLLAALIIISASISVAGAKKLDFFGNNLADWVTLTFPPKGGQIRWRILKNENPTPSGGSIIDAPFGLADSDFVPNFGDYDGNGINDLALYRNNSATPVNTYIVTRLNANQQPPGTTTYTSWGRSTTDFIGAEGDYDGDGKMDYTIVRTTGVSRVWWVLRSSDGSFMTFTYGSSIDTPLPGADYDGDGRDDPAVFRVAGSGQITWFVGTTTGAQISQTAWGDFDTDFVIPGGDYDGDGRADFMVWRGYTSASDGVWYLRTSSGNISYTRFGIPGTDFDAGDTALRGGDYDGDGKTDIAIYRPSTLTFWVARSTGGLLIQQWGESGQTNRPLASFGTY